MLAWLAGGADLEDIHGDLDEAYAYDRTKSPKWKADLHYWRQVLSLLFSYALRRRKRAASFSPYTSSHSMAMFRNYFKIAFRNFAKHKLFTTLNIFGLALGMSICLIALTVIVTLSLLDEFHENKHRVYQVNTYLGDGVDGANYSSTFYATGDHLRDNYPFVEEIVNISSDFRPVVNHHGHEIPFSGYFADRAFFEVFSFNLISGHPSAVLKDPFSVVLTEKTARKLFREDNPIGKTLETDLGVFHVTGVMENPCQTHFFFDMLTSYETLTQTAAVDPKNDWKNYRNHYAYLMVEEGTQKEDLDRALSQTAQLASAFHTDKTVTLQAKEVSRLLPISWNTRNPLGASWDQGSIAFFIGIGLLMLMPAVFNHTNLSIARSLKRAKEIGIRKVVGAQKRQIKGQFLVETVVMALLALGLSFVIMVPMKNEFLDMVYFSEVLDTDLNAFQVVVFLAFAVFVGLVAGFFPAQYFARLTPTQTLKGDVLNGRNGASGFKKGLFVFQFFVSLVFIIGVGAISKQYAFVLNSNHGFESENVLTIPFYGIDKRVAMNELAGHPDVITATASSHLPGILVADRVDVTSNGQDSVSSIQVFVAADFVENMGMELIWGASAPIEHPNQSEEAVLVNEQFIKSLKVFNEQQDTLRFTLTDGTKCRIVGILKDFNYEPLSEWIEPLIMRYSLEESLFALLTVKSANIGATIAELAMIWEDVDQAAGFEATFLESEIEEAYFIVEAQLKFFSALSFLAITVSCLGLLGMVSYTTENRTKEIAVRKIMGATNFSLYYLLTKDFVQLIGLAALLAIPFSYVFYDKIFLRLLLRYGSGLGPIEVILSITFLFLVGAISIYWQTSKVAKANPATKLRYE
ncbi:MAG: ABC transporter permease [Bacteroidota bacterium]